MVALRGSFEMDIYGAGEKARIVWALTALLMFLLTIGQTILMKPDVIANRLGLVNVNVAVCVWNGTDLSHSIVFSPLSPGCM